MDLEFEKEHGYVKIKGKYYLPEEDGMKGILQFKEVKDAVQKIKKAKEIAKHLKDGLDREIVLTEAIMKLEPKEFDTLYKMFKSGKKYKQKMREHRCVDMKVGNFVLPIVE